MAGSPRKKTTRKAAATRTAGAKTARATKATAPKRALTEYRRKRDFSRTAEPAGDEPGAKAPKPSRGAKPLRFVVQKHAASHLHFDLRLELDGVMKSWAVPKGPSLDPAVKRLAMQVEDHPISYNTFEGTIPEGEYGGGTVMLWDRGRYLPADGDPASLRTGLKKGRLDFVMLGDRLKGGFTMVRSGRDTGKPQWLLFKRTDEYADTAYDVVAEETTSVTTGRTMEEIAGSARAPAAKKKTRPASRK